jgi:hypothetical protein
VNYIAMGMRNRLSKPRGSIGNNMTGRLPRYVVLQYERIIKYLILNTNNAAFQIIHRDHNFAFHRRPEEYAGQVRCVSIIRPIAFYRMNNLSLEQLDVWSRKAKYYKYVIDDKNISMFGFIDASWGYGHRGMNDDVKIDCQKRQSSFQSSCKFW